MSLFQRQPRPLTRDSASLRDDRLFIIACDDTYAPKQYFDFFRITRIQIHVVPTQDGTSVAEHVLNRLLQFDHEEDDELWLLLDVDHCTQGNHIRSFLDAIGRARQRGINIALSKPCFEFWLLLHHEEVASAELSTATEVESALRNKLGQYNKTNLKREHYPLRSVADACIRAQRLDAGVSGGDVPDRNTSRVYLIWKAILAKALPSQLPDELKVVLTVQSESEYP